MASGMIKSNLIKLIPFSKSYTISYNVGADNLVNVPSGYTAVAPIQYDTGSGDVAVIAVKPNALTLSRFRSAGTSSTFTCTGAVLCVKTDMIAT